MNVGKEVIDFHYLTVKVAHKMSYLLHLQSNKESGIDMVRYGNEAENRKVHSICPNFTSSTP